MQLDGVLFLLMLNASVTESGINPWRSFLDSPSKAHSQECKALIREANRDTSRLKCDEIRNQLLQDGNLSRFQRLVESGNELSMDLCFQLHPVFRGYVADVEDFNISLGKSMKRNPSAFLSMLDRYQISEGGICDIVDNLGEDLEDNVKGQMRELRERIAVVNKIPKTLHPTQRATCLTCMRELLRALEDGGAKRNSY